MILQALNDYYKRLNSNPDVDIPEFGYSNEKISFSLVLNKEGDLVQIKDLREKAGKGKLQPRFLIVPSITETAARSNGVVSNFLWDKSEYVLGIDSKGKINKSSAKYLHFKQRILDISSQYKDEGLNTVASFFNKWEQGKFTNLLTSDNKKWEGIKKGVNFVFELDTDINCFIHERINVKEAWSNYFYNREKEYSNKKNKSPAEGLCLISGNIAQLARVHRKIKGINKMKKPGALVGFNNESCLSYNKTQGFNAPISIKSAFSYTTALNHLLSSTNQNIRIGDTSTVFWTEKKSSFETMFGKIMDQKNDGSDDNIKLFLEAVRDGKNPKDIELDVPFYILALAPNEARISVRFWHVSTIGDIAEKIGQHFKDIKIIKELEDKDSFFPSIFKLLLETTPFRKNQKRKSENIPPLLGGALIRSIITGQSYPESLLSILITRIRADGHINYIRTSMLKGIINRKIRIQKLKLKEIEMSLDKENKEHAYLLGRLFAVLEKAQQEAIPEANTTIKDRFFGAACATPKIVFPQILKNTQNHISKVKSVKGISFPDRLIEEIMADIKEFPAHLSLNEQGLFTIGYYHQRKDIWTKKENKK